MIRSFAPALALAVVSSSACTKSSPAPITEGDLTFELDRHWPEDTSYPGVGQGRLIITNNLADTVSILDYATLSDPSQTELARVPVGLIPIELEGPHHAALDPAGQYYYVGISNSVPGGGTGPHASHGGNTADGFALKYRASDNRLTGVARVDPNPGDIIVSKDGKTLYVTHYDLKRIIDAQRMGDPSKANARLAVIDAEMMTRKAMIDLCPAPHGVQLSADERYAYAACLTDELAIVDLMDPNFPVQRVKVAPDAGTGPGDTVFEPYAVMVSPTAGDVWVSCPKDRSIVVFNPATSQMDNARAVQIDGRPIFGAFSADGTRLYVAHQLNDGIAVIDPATSQVIQDIRPSADECKFPHQFVLTPDGQYGLLVCEGVHDLAIGPPEEGTLVVLQMQPDVAIHHVVRLGMFPDFVGVLGGTR